MARSREDWHEIVSRDYHHLPADEHERIVDSIMDTHPDHQSVPVPTAAVSSPVIANEVPTAEPKLLVPMVNFPAVPDYTLWLKRIFGALLLIAFILVASLFTHAQRGTSQIDRICFLNSNLPGGQQCYASPFNLNLTGTSSCTASGTTLTCNISGGSVTNNPGGSANYLQYNNGGAFGGIDPGTAGKVLISQPSGPPLFADPLVQGLYAAGTTTPPNPVVMGGMNYGGTNTIRSLKVADDGSLIATIVFAAPQHTIIDSSASIGVTNAALTAMQFDPSNYLKVILQNTSLAVTGTFWQAKQPVSLADGDDATQGAKADARNAATDTTPVTVIGLLKQLSYMLQNPASRAVTNAGTFAVQPNDGAGHAQPAGDASARSIHVTPDSLPTLPIGSNTIGKVNVLGNAGGIFDQAPGSAVPANAIQMAGTDGTNTTVPYIDPCQRGPKTYTPITLASTTVTKLVSLASSKTIYVCSINLLAAGANNVALLTGTKTTIECDTGTAGVNGGTTAASGWNFAANGGIALGSGGYALMAGGTSKDICISASANTQVSGTLVTATY